MLIGKYANQKNSIEVSYQGGEQTIVFFFNSGTEVRVIRAKMMSDYENKFNGECIENSFRGSQKVFKKIYQYSERMNNDGAHHFIDVDEFELVSPHTRPDKFEMLVFSVRFKFEPDFKNV